MYQRLTCLCQMYIHSLTDLHRTRSILQHNVLTLIFPVGWNVIDNGRLRGWQILWLFWVHKLGNVFVNCHLNCPVVFRVKLTADWHKHIDIKWTKPKNKSLYVDRKVLYWVWPFWWTADQVLTENIVAKT